MTRLIRIWLVLFAANLFAAATIGILAFEVVDLRFEAFAQVIIIPWAQTLAVWLLFLREPRTVPLVGALKQVFTRQPALALFLAADVIVLAASWGWPPGSAEEIARDWRIAALYVGLKAIIGGSLVLGFLLGSRRWSTRQSAWVAALGLGVVTYGSTCFFDWLRLIPQLVLPSWPLLFRWLVFYGPLFIASLWVLLRVEAIWRSHSPVAARILELVPALALVSATVIVLGIYNNPQIPPFWDQVERSFSLLAVSALWAAVWHYRQET